MVEGHENLLVLILEANESDGRRIWVTLLTGAASERCSAVEGRASTSADLAVGDGRSET